ncbi:MAG: hypothetical protein P8008_05045, partial [Gammaproteobacteria bacterium]
AMAAAAPETVSETGAPPTPAAMLEDVNAPSAIAPPVADGVETSYLDPAAPWAKDLGADPTSTRLAPAAAVTVQLLYDDTRADLNHTETYEAVVFPLDGVIDVGDVLSVDHDARDFRPEAPAGARYELGNTKLQTKSFWTSLSSDLKNHLVAHRELELRACPPLKLYSRVGESEEEFSARCRAAADEIADQEIVKLRDRYGRRIERLQNQISAADLRVKELEDDASARTQAEVMSGIGDLLGAVLSGRFGSSTLNKAASRRTASRKAKARLETAQEKLDAKQQDLVELEQELEDALVEIQQEHDAMAEARETVEIGLEKTDIRVAEAKLVWVPVA